MSWAAVVTAILPPLASAVEKHVPDAGKANELKAELAAALLSQDGDAQRAAAEVIKAEAAGESRLQRTWRPMLMLVFTAVIAREYLIAPALFPGYQPQDLPEHLWTLLQWGVSGYIGGRSVEKVAGRIAEAIRR